MFASIVRISRSDDGGDSTARRLGDGSVPQALLIEHALGRLAGCSWSRETYWFLQIQPRLFACDTSVEATYVLQRVRRHRPVLIAAGKRTAETTHSTQIYPCHGSFSRSVYPRLL